jgi:hypothetical protein
LAAGVRPAPSHPARLAGGCLTILTRRDGQGDADDFDAHNYVAERLGGQRHAGGQMGGPVVGKLR